MVSVAMLTEGWDANNVTHILGIRAFDSQLLCEQVVGRGLRRMNYTPDPQTELLPEEYVDVYGIPFNHTLQREVLARPRRRPSGQPCSRSEGTGGICVGVPRMSRAMSMHCGSRQFE